MYTENLVREFYAKLTAGIKDPQVHIWCGLCEGDYITLTLANIVEFLSCPHYAEIKGTVLDEDVDWDHVAQCFLPPTQLQYLLPLLDPPSNNPQGGPPTRSVSITPAPETSARASQHPFADIELPKVISKLDQIETAVAKIGTKFLSKLDIVHDRLTTMMTTHVVSSGWYLVSSEFSKVNSTRDPLEIIRR
ncbi:hypothetical protein M9H77_02571 [Catharanthus roseus]|uniref:Uncharacterized protein n=1 Tax=Catharanthus roseus TaxID=4058 RepID=A0ACC0C972_CATRO|nr:hypothetical protein M9H77_02571 [Catharanthus roseus]